METSLPSNHYFRAKMDWTKSHPLILNTPKQPWFSRTFTHNWYHSGGVYYLAEGDTSARNLSVSAIFGLVFQVCEWANYSAITYLWRNLLPPIQWWMEGAQLAERCSGVPNKHGQFELRIEFRNHMIAIMLFNIKSVSGVHWESIENISFLNCRCCNRSGLGSLPDH